MKPICIPCRRFFRMKKGGVVFIEGMPRDNTRPRPGWADADKWEPYKAWRGDLWHCPDCGAEIVSGVASHNFAEHFQSDFAQRVTEAGGAEWQINDC